MRLWSKDRSPALHLDPESRHASEIDALASILPMDRRARLAELLTDDVETLKRLSRQGMGENSLRALASDLAYLEAWAAAAAGHPPPWPATEALTLKFVGIISGIRRNAGSTPDMGCLRTSPRACVRRGCCVAMAPMPERRQPAPRELEHIAPPERGRGTVRLAESALGRSRLAASTRARPAQRIV